MTQLLDSKSSHGGIVAPLDMFRVSALTAMTAEMLIGKARNILDAKMVFTRHPTSQIVLMSIEGSVVGDDAAAFWRENADIAIGLSQGLRTQCFLYYAKTQPATERREGFVVAQRGQALAADDTSADQQPTTGEGNWPVAKLCEQLRISFADLEGGFPGGPRVEVPMAEPTGSDDQAALMTLAGQPAEGAEGEGDGGALGDVAADPGQRPTPPATQAGSPAPVPGTNKPKITVEQDLKRREKERQAEEEAQRERASAVQSGMRHVVDETGVVVAPDAELSEPDILAPFVVSTISGDLPPGLPAELTKSVQGKRCDFAVKVDFLSEVFIANAPLSKPDFQSQAETRTIGGRELRVLEVLAPRLGYGALLSTGKAPHIFVSRKPSLPLPEALILELLD